LALVVLLVTGLAASRQVATWPARLQYPGEGALGGDSMPLADIVHLARGVPIYAQASAEAYYGANWGPLFYLLGARLVDLQNPSYRPLRMLSLAGILGCAAGAALLAFWYMGSKLAAALAPLLFLSYGFLTRYGISSRADMVALLLSVCGFLVAYRFRNSRRLLLAVPLFLVSIYYKQQFVAGPLAVLLFLALEKCYRRAAEFGGAIAMGGVGLLLYFQYGVFAGQSFFHHFVLYNLLPFTEPACGVLFFLVFLLIPFLMGVQALREQPDKLLACFLGSAVFISLATSPRAGSDAYYFSESVFILSVLVPGLLTKRLGELSRPLGLVLLYCVAVGIAHLSPPAPTREDLQREQALQNYLRQHFAPRTAALGYLSGDFVRAGLDTPISNLFHFSSLVRKGAFSDRELVSQLRAHRFGLVVLHFDLWPGRDDYTANFYTTAPLREAIWQNYRPADVLDLPEPAKLRPEDRFYVWVPRN